MAPLLITLCWPMMTLLLTIAFSCGCLLGKLLKCEGSLPFERNGQHGGERSLWVERMKMNSGQDEVTFFLSKSGTKVHLDAQCPKLNGAHPLTLTDKKLCKYCMKHAKFHKNEERKSQ